MTTANDILGTSGKEAIPFEYQIEEQKIARERALAQLMVTKSMQKAPTQMYGRHRVRTGASEHLANAFSAYMGQKGLADANEASSSMASRMNAAKQADLSGVMSTLNGTPGKLTEQEGPPAEGQSALPNIMTGGTSGDTRGAIAQAMQSRFPSVNAYGADLQKNERSRIAEQMKLLGTVDPIAAVRREQEQNPMSKVPSLTPTPVQSMNLPGGDTLAFTQSPLGKTEFKFAHKPPVVTVNNGTKTDVELDKEQIGMLKTSKDSASTATNSISNAIRVNELSNQGADAGGGGSIRQSVRKFGQAFGVDIPVTGMTEEMRMRMGDSVLDAARKLAPVTGNDVVLLQQLLGSIDTDPRALKEINALMLAKGLMTQDKHNALVEETRNVSSGNPIKYNPFRISRGNIDAKDPALLGRAYQLMKESGHDMAGYFYDGKPVGEINLNIGFTKPEGRETLPPLQNLPPRFKKVN